MRPCFHASIYSMTHDDVCTSSTPFQRIAAADLAPGLQFFGRSISGTMDMNHDGLVDLAVGSFGAAVVLWYVLFWFCVKSKQELRNTIGLVEYSD